MQSQLTTQYQEGIEEKRQFLKAQIRLGWSAEAVKQGVAHAKKGEHDSAISCYKKVSRADSLVTARAVNLNVQVVQHYIQHPACNPSCTNSGALARHILCVSRLMISPSHACAGIRLESAQCRCLGCAGRSIRQPARLSSSYIRPPDCTW